jgi:hypothetical protein
MVVALLGASLPTVAVAASGAPPRAELRDFECQRALDPVARAVSVTAVMRPLVGTQKMEMNFSLMEKADGASSWSAVSGSGLGVWITPSDPTLGQRPGDVWNVNHPVADLAAPARYRFVVRFRWSGDHAKVLGTSTLVSRACDQPELRPDLVVESIEVTADSSHPRLNIYTAHIGDTGDSGAGPFSVQLSDQGVVTDKTVQHIAAYGTRTVHLVGPACSPADPPTVTVDPTDQVDVSSRAQASLTAQCPAPAAG